MYENRKKTKFNCATQKTAPLYNCSEGREMK
jgi:hypothetical protein